MLQAGEEHSFIRHGIITLGALNKSLKLMGPWIIRFPGDYEPFSTTSEHELALVSHHKYTLWQYSKFFEGLRQHMTRTTQQNGLRLALIAVIMIYCIENMQLHHEAAIKVAHNGFRMIKQLLPRMERRSSWSPPCHT